MLELGDSGDAAYAATTEAILHHAQKLAGKEGDHSEETGVVAVSVWEGQSRGPGDFTEQFVRAARALGLRVRNVRTL